jgi:class 3 adenylate cyclase
LSRVIGQWLAQCKEAIEQCGGRINQFLGDGFLAFWYDGEGVEAEVDKAIRALAHFQSQDTLAFRFVVHLGSVMVGGIAVGEEESLSGGEMHFVFRMEKLAGSLGELRLVSEEARKRLAPLVRARGVGRHRLQGFSGNFHFYTL